MKQDPLSCSVCFTSGSKILVYGPLMCVLEGRQEMVWIRVFGC